MDSVLVVQHHDHSPAGVVGEAIKSAGLALEVVSPTSDDAIPADAGKFRALLLLGGNDSAADGHTPHYIQELTALIREFADQSRPVMGICLGAQMVARAFGARVHRNFGAEFGFVPLKKTAQGHRDPIVESLPDPSYFMQWHDDSLDLPIGAELLMVGERYVNQCFRIGRLVYGFQFHMEVDQQIVEDWARAPGANTAANGCAVSIIKHQRRAHLKQAMAYGRHIGERWIALL